MMDWQKKMLEGMRLMLEACGENDQWHNCHRCPFDEYCTALMDAAQIDPLTGLDWEWVKDTKTD